MFTNKMRYLLGVGTWLGTPFIHKSARAGNAAQNLAWATILTWTLVMNVYVPVYDTLPITVAITLMIRALREVEGFNVTGSSFYWRSGSRQFP